MNSISTQLTAAELARGHVIREPVGQSNGYWAGAPGVFHDAKERAFYLTYRIRRPRGVQPDRGGEVKIARSTDGRNFTDLWTMTKDQVNSASIERTAIWRGDDGQWRYFASYVDPADGRWCTTMLKALEIRHFDPRNMQRLFIASELKLEGVKDPWIIRIEGVYHMFLSVALPVPQTGKESHATLDIFNTGECLSATALATSLDLDRWDWHGVIFAPSGNAWDRYCRRINSVLPLGGQFLAFYDGSAGHHENYEERTGLAVSADLRSWQTRTPDAPHFTSPHASGSLRYLDAQSVDGRLHLFYEFARADGAHDLRVVTTDAGAFHFTA